MRKFECRIIPLDRDQEFQHLDECIITYYAMSQENAEYKAWNVFSQPFPMSTVDYVKPI